MSDEQPKYPFLSYLLTAFLAIGGFLAVKMWDYNTAIAEVKANMVRHQAEADRLILLYERRWEITQDWLRRLEDELEDCQENRPKKK